MKPTADGASGFCKIAEIMLPGAFLFQATKEPFNQTVLLRRIRRNVFLRQPIILTSSPETTALENQAVIAPDRWHFTADLQDSTYPSFRSLRQSGLHSSDFHEGKGGSKGRNLLASFRISKSRTSSPTFCFNRLICSSFTNYNQKRPHQGRNMNGKTPNQVFLEGLPGDLPQERGSRPLKYSPRQGKVSGEYLTCTPWRHRLPGPESLLPRPGLNLITTAESKGGWRLGIDRAI